ncbi:hypothetical protein SUNI508_08376 [Seiridium unicorne]|uniref:Uncharacterized protein n=1 Tax=Seiridium unicorne TaxID=138068 RepID=A0ABR2UUI6_9PEZI
MAVETADPFTSLHACAASRLHLAAVPGSAQCVVQQRRWGCEKEKERGTFVHTEPRSSATTSNPKGAAGYHR